MEEQKKLADKPELQELIAAFHLMWDHFPEPVQLTHKSFEIIAMNPSMEIIGRHVGMRCIKHGPAESHKGCLAHKALNEHKAKYSTSIINGKESVAYWLPVDGYPDYYLHFGTRVIIDY